MKPLVKICGLTQARDVETAIACGADYLGFIVECASPRRLSVAQAARLSAPAVRIAKRVAVTVNPDAGLLARIAAQMRPDFLQLHGSESPEQAAHIKADTGLGIIKAISIRTKDDLKQAADYAGIADYILLDAKPPKGTTQRGGHGTTFDWKILHGFSCKTPLILAGGLDAHNAPRATATGIKFFDVSSGVEASAGVKDPSLMRAFMKAIHE